MLKKLLLIMSMCTMVGCTAKEPTPEIEHTQYFTNGRYCSEGQVITADGNIWNYAQDIISEKPSYHNEPVIAVFDDNGTPDDIYDDAILGLVLDRETAIYDALEVSLSDAFEFERDGNNIHIHSIKENEKGE